MRPRVVTLDDVCLQLFKTSKMHPWYREQRIADTMLAMAVLRCSRATLFRRVREAGGMKAALERGELRLRELERGSHNPARPGRPGRKSQNRSGRALLAIALAVVGLSGSGCAAIRPTCVCVCEMQRRPAMAPALDYLDALQALDEAKAAATAAAEGGAE